MTTGTGLSADTQALMAFESQKKSAGTAYLLWFFLGGVGGHRFYLGSTGPAVGQLILFVLGWTTIWFFIGFFFLVPLGIWLLVDVFMISDMVRNHNQALATQLNARSSSSVPAESAVDELGKFAVLRDQGAITPEEYDEQKRRLLGTPAVAPQAAPTQPAVRPMDSDTAAEPRG